LWSMSLLSTKILIIELVILSIAIFFATSSKKSQ
jgi:hypothetical protein